MSSVGRNSRPPRRSTSPPGSSYGRTGEALPQPANDGIGSGRLQRAGSAGGSLGGAVPSRRAHSSAAHALLMPAAQLHTLAVHTGKAFRNLADKFKFLRRPPFYLGPTWPAARGGALPGTSHGGALPTDPAATAAAKCFPMAPYQHAGDSEEDSPWSERSGPAKAGRRPLPPLAGGRTFSAPASEPSNPFAPGSVHRRRLQALMSPMAMMRGQKPAGMQGPPQVSSAPGDQMLTSAPPCIPPYLVPFRSLLT